MLAEKLRKLAARGQYGHARKPDNFYMSGSGFEWAHTDKSLFGDVATFERVAALSKRYHAFVRYCREVAPQWVEVDRIHWADNSIEAVQVDKDGNQRRVMVAAPSGDRCF